MSSTRSLFANGLMTTALAAALVACGGNAPSDAPAPSNSGTDIVADTAALPEEIRLTDSYGQFGGTVSAMAVWQHPTQSFRSGILVANGAAGLYLVPLDRTEPIQTPGNFAGGVAVGYTDTSAIAAAYDSDLRGVRFYTVDPATRGLAEFTTTATSDGAKVLCFVDETLIRIADDNRVYRHQLSVEDGAVVVSVETVANVTATACGSSADTAYLLSSGGRVVPIREDGDALASIAAPRDAVGIAALETGENDELVFVQENGTVTAGEQVVLVADTAGPLAASQIIAGSGNFGGAYRGGVVGVLSSDNDLGAVSWLAIANTVGANADTISPQGVNAGVGADLAGEIAETDGEIDTSLDDEAEERLDSFRTPPGE